MDFTQMPVSQGYKYLLVMIDTFTGWIEGFPTQTEKAKEVIKNNPWTEEPGGLQSIGSQGVRHD